MSYRATKCPCNPEPGKMQAITAILNPDSVDRGDLEQKMLLFQSLSINNTVGYDQFEIDDGSQIKAQTEGSVKGYYGDKNVYVPSLKFQSKLISMVVDDTVNVYGTITSDSICLMSPVFMPLPGAVAKNGIIGGCSNGDNESWLYFQENGSGKILERSLSHLEADNIPIPKTGDAKENTDIVAFWDGNHRWIVFQDGETDDVTMRCLDLPDFNTIKDSGKIVGGYTKLAVVHTQLEDRIRIYLYMTTAKFELYRAHADVLNEGGLKWSALSSLQSGVSVADYTWFDVEADAKRTKNLIYAIPKGQSKGPTKIKCTEDKWASGK